MKFYRKELIFNILSRCTFVIITPQMKETPDESEIRECPYLVK